VDAAGERPGLELAGVETVYEGVGAARLPAWVTRWVGDGRYPFGTWIERLRDEKTAVLILAQTFYLSTGKNRSHEAFKKSLDKRYFIWHFVARRAFFARRSNLA
jgi:hypothetical protein